MKVLKYLMGTLAALYALAQIASLLLCIANGTLAQLSPSYAGGFIGGKLGGIAIGAAIAVLCFRKSKNTP